MEAKKTVFIPKKKSWLETWPVKVIRVISLAAMLFCVTMMPPNMWAVALAALVLAVINMNKSVAAGLRYTWHAIRLASLILLASAVTTVVAFAMMLNIPNATLNIYFVTIVCLVVGIVADAKWYAAKMTAKTREGGVILTTDSN